MSFRIPWRDAEIRFMNKFGGNRPLQSCQKVIWFTTQKTSLSTGLVSAPILPKMGRSCPKLPERCHPLICPTYTEFSPGRLHFAGLISERLIFRPKKWLRFRLSAYSNDNALLVQQMCTSYLQFVHSSTNVSVSNRTAWTYHFYWIDRVMICRLMAFSRIHQLLLRLCVYICMCVCVIMS